MISSRLYSILLHLLLLIIPTTADRSDRRCKCLCKADTELDIESKIYISANTSVIKTANDCGCINVVVPTLHRENVTVDETEYCKLCGCEFETRSVYIIDFSMTIYLLLLSFLLCYFLLIHFDILKKTEDTNINQNRALSRQHSNTSAYSEVRNLEDNYADDQNILPRDKKGRLNSLSANNSALFRRITEDINLWKNSVEQQREAVFDKREVCH